jgi:hypothetical protein
MIDEIKQDIINKNIELDKEIRVLITEKQKIKEEAHEYLFQKDNISFQLCSIGSALGTLSFEVNQSIKLTLNLTREKDFFYIAFLMKDITGKGNFKDRIAYPFYLNKEEKSQEDIEFLKYEIFPKISNLISMIDKEDIIIFDKIMLLKKLSKEVIERKNTIKKNKTILQEKRYEKELESFDFMFGNFKESEYESYLMLNKTDDKYVYAVDYAVNDKGLMFRNIKLQRKNELYKVRNGFYRTRGNFSERNTEMKYLVNNGRFISFDNFIRDNEIPKGYLRGNKFVIPFAHIKLVFRSAFMKQKIANF